MKRAFTMIELIFVIVILGILAAVAIPKLSATRDDARVSVVAKQVATGINEIASYVTTKGKSADSIDKMSNSFNALSSSGYATINGKKATVGVGGVANCIEVEIKSVGDDEIITVSHSGSANDSCKSLQSIIDKDKYSIKIKGISVIF